MTIAARGDIPEDMMKPSGLEIGVALAVAATALVSSVWVPYEHLTALVSDDVGLAFFSAWTLAAIPLAFAMSRLRASFFGRAWRVPSHTFVLPRAVVRLCIGVIIGQLVGFLLLASARDHRLFWLAGSTTLIGAAFCAGARGRLKKRPSTEFTMPWCRLR
ncbi:MAG: hypothetical protein ACYC35_20525 [Pirellulales bacterium]